MLAQNQTSIPMLGTSNGWRGPLTCGRCGHQQRTRARGDHTRCRECGASIYVPANLQHRAILRPYRQPGPKPKPKADKAPRSVTTTRTVPNTDALGGLLTFATNYVAARAAAKHAPKIAPVAVAALSASPPVPRRDPGLTMGPTVSREARTMAYRITSGPEHCESGWPDNNPPAMVWCRLHDRAEPVNNLDAAENARRPLEMAIPA
jgi:hypothetical protein